MTTETHKFRSMKQAEAFVAERGLTMEQFPLGIVREATAKYTITIVAEETPAEETKPKKLRAQTIDRHWNDDGSLTIYENGRKVRRFGGEENEEASEEEIEDTESFVERWLNRRHPKKAGGWKYGRTTQGHNWHTKRQKMLRQRIADAEAAGQPTTELQAELDRLSSRGA